MATKQTTLRAMMKTMETGDRRLWIEVSTVKPMAAEGKMTEGEPKVRGAHREV